MTPQQYLEHKLKNCAHYKLSMHEQENLRSAGLKQFLFGQITRKKFRRWKLPDLARQRIERALDHCITKQQPILFRFRFGGYKLWQLESAPEVDWAEFFSLAYYSEYLAPIIAVHKPGVKLWFMSDDIFVERLDNVPKSDTESYCSSFQELCAEFKKFAPENFSLEIMRHSALYNSTEELDIELHAKMKEVEEDWKERQSPGRLRSELATSALNIKWDGASNLTGLSEVEKKKMIERSAVMHDAIVQLPTILAFSAKNPGMISLFTTQFPGVVSIGTTKTSIVKFWVGAGVLENRNGRYLDRILSPGQIEKIANISPREVALDLLPLKNFSAIRIFDQKLDFVIR